jgi:hypothetical protein
MTLSCPHLKPPRGIHMDKWLGRYDSFTRSIQGQSSRHLSHRIIAAEIHYHQQGLTYLLTSQKDSITESVILYAKKVSFLSKSFILSIEWRDYKQRWNDKEKMEVVVAYLKAWGFHSDDCLECGILGRNNIYFCRKIPIFRRNMLPPSSELWGIGLLI